MANVRTDVSSRSAFRAGAWLIPCALLLGTAARAGAGSHGSGPQSLFPAEGPRSLVVLDPANLASELPDSEAGATLRQALAQNPHWRVIPGDSSGRMLRRYGLDPDLPCAEFQCAFDAGNALQSEFVLFGTLTDLPELRAFTLDLVHLPTSQVVWSRVGKIPRRFASAPAQKRTGHILEGSLQFAVADMEPASLQLRKRPTLGLLGVMDAGKSSPHSRVALHRALTHAYASRAYDLLGPEELDELVAALDVHGAGASPSRTDSAFAGGPTGPGSAKGQGGSGPQGGAPGGGDDMLSLGTRMGVRYLLWTKVRPEGPDFRLDLTLYDVSGRKAVRHWPAKEAGEFGSLLELEDRFMTVLGDGAPMADPRPPSSHSALRTAGKAASITVAVLAGAALGFLAYQSKRDADADYQRFQDAQSEQEAMEAKKNVVRQDTKARHYGILGGVSLALGTAVWIF